MRLFVGAKGLLYRNGKVLLLREASQYADGTQEGRWDVPGGRIEPGEHVRDGLVREIMEEAGLRCVPGEVIATYDHFPNIRGEDCHIVAIYFLVDTISDTITLSPDHDAYDWVDPLNVGDKKLAQNIQEVLNILHSRL